MALDPDCACPAWRGDLQSLTWHMSKAGIPMDPENFDIRRFHESLVELLDVVMKLVAKNMAEELRLKEHFGKDLSGIERVMKILEIAEKVKS
jgi:hypothetical protein